MELRKRTYRIPPEVDEAIKKAKEDDEEIRGANQIVVRLLRRGLEEMGLLKKRKRNKGTQ